MDKDLTVVEEKELQEVKEDLREMTEEEILESLETMEFGHGKEA